ncbi:Phosphoserine aminotransferase [Pseudomonas syringae pv. actinidiae]|uniref:Phosphoserine aminotransferase n=1 Tax=Pseudomonas syringae pv. actinidiae TaxID=103796 RepID=A0A2V0Q7Z6_PSESF|nr:Phosphoserine aminotransferase [Pseudomonas syringae pv. actinidiae]
MIFISISPQVCLLRILSRRGLRQIEVSRFSLTRLVKGQLQKSRLADVSDYGGGSAGNDFSNGSPSGVTILIVHETTVDRDHFN